MEKKPVDLPALFKDGGKAAGGGVLLSLLLLLPLTVMVRAGISPMAAVPACVWLTAGVSAFLAQRLLTTEKGRGAVPRALASEVVFALFLLVLAAGVPGAQMSFRGLLPVLGFALAGYLAASFIGNNKKYTRPKHAKRRYYR